MMLIMSAPGASGRPPLVPACAAVERRLRAAVRRTLREAGAGAATPLVVACSGGADSVALLWATVGVRGAGQRIAAVYVDHRLRPDTALEAALVERHAARLGADFAVEVAAVARTGGARRASGAPGRSSEDAARQARYRALARVARRLGSAFVLVAHTRRDQAETVILRLLQGAGPGGLAAMTRIGAWPVAPPAGSGAGADAGAMPGVLRPFLDVGRDEVEALIAGRRLEFAVDPTNLAPGFLRNRLRLEVMPRLDQLSPGLERRLAGLAELLAEERTVREQLLDAQLRQRQVPPPAAEGGPTALLGLDLRDADPALRRALLHRALQTLPGAPRPSRDQLRQLATGGATDLGGGLTGILRGGYLRILGRRP
jgi:tRNA(Ile)-lysidine synthase